MLVTKAVFIVLYPKKGLLLRDINIRLLVLFFRDFLQVKIGDLYAKNTT